MLFRSVFFAHPKCLDITVVSPNANPSISDWLSDLHAEMAACLSAELGTDIGYAGQEHVLQLVLGHQSAGTECTTKS